jgi:hypothetical protein
MKMSLETKKTKSGSNTIKKTKRKSMPGSRKCFHGLKPAKKIPLRDIRDTDWGLFCPEYFSQYLGWDVWWLGSAPSMRIYFTKPSETEIPLQNSETTAEFLLNSTIAPEIVTILDFKRPEYASLEPIELDLWRAGGLKLKLWFLGYDMLRLEMDTSYHTESRGIS